MMQLRVCLFVLLLFLLSSTFTSAQSTYRFSADFTSKGKLADSVYELTMGEIYYDLNYQKVVYDIHFPEPSTQVIHNNKIYSFKTDSGVKTAKAPMPTKFSIFHLTLNNKLKNYGLENQSSFEITNIDRSDSLIVITWSPTGDLEGKVGEIKMAQKDMKLQAIVFFNKEGDVISKQFYENYINKKGHHFPTRIVQIYYIQPPQDKVDEENNFPSEKKIYQITSLENIKINEPGKEHLYNYNLPD